MAWEAPLGGTAHGALSPAAHPHGDPLSPQKLVVCPWPSSRAQLSLPPPHSGGTISHSLGSSSEDSASPFTQKICSQLLAELDSGEPSLLPSPLRTEVSTPCFPQSCPLLPGVAAHSGQASRRHWASGPQDLLELLGWVPHGPGPLRGPFACQDPSSPRTIYSTQQKSSMPHGSSMSFLRDGLALWSRVERKGG